MLARRSPYRKLAVLVIAGLVAPGAAGLTALAPTAWAQEITPDVPATANGTANRDAADIDAEVTRGRALQEADDEDAVAVLRNAAQRALVALFAVTGPSIITAPPAPDQTPTDPFTIGLIHRAATTHYYWGLAADHFGKTDAAITALARASRLAGVIRYYDSTLARDTANQLINGSLKSGLPLNAPDDTLDIIAASMGHLWQPRRLHFDFSRLTFNPTLHGGAADPAQTQDFLITDGKLLPPHLTGQPDPNLALVRIPPLYRKVPLGNLPGVLQLNQMIVGFEKATEGPNRGLWHQVVQVFYASPFLTRNGRDDRPRAEAMAIQFLKVRALTRAGLGLENPYTHETNNPYTHDGLTTLWLSEVSAWWPLDDDDPAVQDALGTRMPPPNTPVVVNGKKVLQNDVKWSPLSYPWHYDLPDMEVANTVGVIPNPQGVPQTGTAATTGAATGTPATGTRPPAPGIVRTSATGAPPAASPIATAVTAPNSGAGAAQIASDWGEIMYFKMSQPRDETEWLRETIHEYGHVTLPPFTGFQPPLEPYGNGRVGETIGMTWAAAIPAAFAVDTTDDATAGAQDGATGIAAAPAPDAPPAPDPELTQGLYDHVARNAMPALSFWNAHGPASPLRTDGGNDGLQYLQGLAVYLERVYGAHVLSDAVKPIVQRVAATAVNDSQPDLSALDNLDTVDLLDSATQTLRTTFTGELRRLPIWLPGALDLPSTRQSPAAFATRAPLALQAGERVPCWLFVPAGAGTLHIEWQAATPGATLQVEGGWKTDAAPSRAIDINVATRPGWQRFAFVPSDALTLTSAWFERAPDATRPVVTAERSTR